jgi:hypothetical protein
MEKPLMQGPFYNENREITVYCIFGGNLGYIEDYFSNMEGNCTSP